jgi:Glycosyl hydrolases family 2, TIM barrel domain/Glycosyl hydrolases family 2, sugar binding domain/Glycosyl hydrolases family 2
MRTLLAVLALALTAVAIGAATAQEAPPVDTAGASGRVALSGPWTVRVGGSDRARTRGWVAGAFRGVAVPAPYVLNALPVTGAGGLLGYRGAVAWFRTTFSVPADGDYALRFESVHHRADVWLDGDLLGSHTGAYLPFEERFYATAGRHVLVVRADWRDPAGMKRAGWHRTWFNFGGLNREVTLRPVGNSGVSAPTVRTTLGMDGSARVDLSVRVHNLGATRDLPVRAVLTHGSDAPIRVDFPATRIPRGHSRLMTTRVVVERPALWSPANPQLYDLSISVPGESSWMGDTGLRELTWHGGRLFLNGVRLVLRGASLQEDARGHGDALTAADMDQLVSDLKAIGANATRAQHPLSPALLERLDAAGILVWQGVGPVDAPGSWTSKTRAQQAQARARVRASLRQLQYHPSIVAWNLANEVAGNGHPGGEAAYVDEMARELHRRDPGRLVALDVWGVHPPDRLGRMYRHVDAIGATNYMGWYEATRTPRDALAQLVGQRAASFERIFRGKVLVISEFGAEASGANPRLAPGGYGFQTRLLATHIRAYARDDRLSGMLIWCLRDFAVAPTFAGGSIRKLVPGIRIVRGLNQKGLFTYGNRPKPAVHVVRAAFERLGLPSS